MNLSSMKNYKRLIASVGLATLMTVAVAAPAFAADSTVDLGITSSGVLSAAYANDSLTGVEYSLVDQDTAGDTLTLTAEDATGTAAGWNVTVSSSDFVYTGANDAVATDIPAENFVFGTPGTPVAVGESQAVEVTGGPGAIGTGGTMDLERIVISADATFGQGSYTQPVEATLTVPARSVVGTYTGTLTTTIASGPGN